MVSKNEKKSIESLDPELKHSGKLRPRSHVVRRQEQEQHLRGRGGDIVEASRTLPEFGIQFT